MDSHGCHSRSGAEREYGFYRLKNQINPAFHDIYANSNLPTFLTGSV
jgi:hypothetical protein